MPAPGDTDDTTVIAPERARGRVRPRVSPVSVAVALGAVFCGLVVAGWFCGRYVSLRAARLAAARMSVVAVANAGQKFRKEHGGACPIDVADLLARGRIRTLDAIDPWGHPIDLRCPRRGGGTHPPSGDVDVDVWSRGRDGIPGTRDDIFWDAGEVKGPTR